MSSSTKGFMALSAVKRTTNSSSCRHALRISSRSPRSLSSASRRSQMNATHGLGRSPGPRLHPVELRKGHMASSMHGPFSVVASRPAASSMASSASVKSSSIRWRQHRPPENNPVPDPSSIAQDRQDSGRPIRPTMLPRSSQISRASSPSEWAGGADSESSSSLRRSCSSASAGDTVPTRPSSLSLTCSLPDPGGHHWPSDTRPGAPSRTERSPRATLNPEPPQSLDRPARTRS